MFNSVNAHFQANVIHVNQDLLNTSDTRIHEDAGNTLLTKCNKVENHPQQIIKMKSDPKTPIEFKNALNISPEKFDTQNTGLHDKKSKVEKNELGLAPSGKGILKKETDAHNEKGYDTAKYPTDFLETISQKIGEATEYLKEIDKTNPSLEKLSNAINSLGNDINSLANDVNSFENKIKFREMRSFYEKKDAQAKTPVTLHKLTAAISSASKYISQQQKNLTEHKRDLSKDNGIIEGLRNEIKFLGNELKIDTQKEETTQLKNNLVIKNQIISEKENAIRALELNKKLALDGIESCEKSLFELRASKTALLAHRKDIFLIKEKYN
jgi:peptidoglycan hydrolase CwlO-like protein